MDAKRIFRKRYIILILLAPFVLLLFSPDARAALEIFLVVRNNFQYNLSPIEISSAKITNLSVADNAFDSDFAYGVEVDLSDCPSADKFFKKNKYRISTDTLPAILPPFFNDAVKNEQGILLLNFQSSTQYIVAYYDSGSCKFYYEEVHL
jgi:hypothetical protein